MLDIGLKLLHFVGEVFVELDAEFLFDFPLIELKATHDRHDDGAAQLVVVVEIKAAAGRKLARLDRFAPGLDFAGVAGVETVDERNRARPQGHHVALGSRGVALEVALDGAVDLSNRELIGFLSEVIHADVAVAVARESLDRIEHDVDAFGRSGQLRGNDAALRLEDVGQVRVVIKRDAIG